MRALIPSLLLFAASPAFAQAPAPSGPQATDEVQRTLRDPGTAEKVGDMMQALSKAFLELRVGEVQAAVEGRKPTARDRKLTVRELGRRGDANFDRNLREQVAASKPMIEASMKALAEALPGMMKSMEEASKSLDRAAANMPSPTYPKR